MAEALDFTDKQSVLIVDDTPENLTLMNGLLKDLYKTEVYEVCEWRNAHNPYGLADDPIPQRILTKPPSAELRPDQKDQDSLPEYAELDAILHGLVEEEATLDEIVARGHAPETVERVQRLLYGSEYKRRQAAPGVKIGPASS